MDCTNVQRLLSDYIDGMCTVEENKIIETHLKECSQCLEEYNLLKSIVDSLANIEDIDVPDGLHNTIMNRIENQQIAIEPKNQQKLKRWYPTVAAAFLMIVVFSVISINSLNNWKSIDRSTENIEYSSMEGNDSEQIEENADMMVTTEDTTNSDTDSAISEDAPMMMEVAPEEAITKDSLQESKLYESQDGGEENVKSSTEIKESDISKEKIENEKDARLRKNYEVNEVKAPIGRVTLLLIGGIIGIAIIGIVIYLIIRENK